jgi:hypothetical protein
MFGIYSEFCHSTSEVSERSEQRSEWNGRKFMQQKILARPHRGRGMSSVHPSVHPSVRLSVRPSVSDRYFVE